ncbi:MAG: alcohol dehydrogenase catalytic domain-containing protein [Micropruina sp.]|nr:MAG: alcohol dehydrogenase catalytic domain-containing protein [Micropruina sp.]
MQAAIIHGAKQLEVVELPAPEPDEGEVRLRVTHVGICGSDLSYYRHGAVGAFVLREPLIPGHELSGVIDLDPSGRWAPGTPVTVHPASPGTELPHLHDRPNVWPGGRYLGSAATNPHVQGAMSELFVARADQIRVLPDELPLRRAALAEPLAVGLHAIAIAQGVEGKKVLVSGAGPIGLLLAGACRVRGASEVWVSDVLGAALERAQGLGFTPVNVAEGPLPTETFDVVFEASGAPVAISGCLNSVVRGGTMVQVGLVPSGTHPIEVAPLAARELIYRGSFRFNEELDEAVAILAEHAWLEAIITHEFPLAELTDAFDCAADAARSSRVLVVLDPGTHDVAGAGS